MIKALIFDFDGLILETETPDYMAWRKIYGEHGHDLPLSTWLKVVGSAFSPHTFDPYLDLENKMGHPIDRRQLAALHNTYETQIITSLPIMPGVEQIIADARQLGLKLAIASSSDRAWVEGHLRRLGLLYHFDAILAAEDVAHVKPAPDLFLAALDALDVAPDEAIILEDSANGVAAARAAGIFCVVVPNDLTRHLDLSQADIRLNSLTDRPLQELLLAAQS